MQKRVALCAIISFASLAAAACTGSGVDETAATTTYNARYVGPATLRSTSPTANYVPNSFTATLTMSQLASTVTGTIVVVGAPPLAPDTVLSAGATGHVTPDGLDLTVVQPLGCAVHLSGPLTLESNGALSGTLAGSNCDSNGASDLRVDLTLTRQ